MQRTGTNVTDRMATAINANDFVNASGRNNLPSIPPSANTGRNETSMMSTEKKIGRPTVRQAAMTVARTSPVTG